MENRKNGVLQLKEQKNTIQVPSHLGVRLPLKVNMLLSAVKGLMSILFPMISFPYISRVLGVENVGRYVFAHSISGYFLLISALGISKYAIREGAGIRDREEFPHFADEMFTINVIATVATYMLLAVAMLLPRLQEYRALLFILSLQIIFTTLGVEWVYSIFEDYLFITIRSVLFQMLSLVLMFVFVHTSDDLLIYAAIMTLSGTGANIWNYFHSRCYCRISLTRRIDWKRHMKPIWILFGMSLTVSIYVSSDTTILGFLCGEYAVGIYSASVKVYTAVKTVLSAILVVSIPRFSSLLGRNDKKAFNQEATNIYSTLLTFVVPAILGIILLRKQIILLLAGNAFISATSSLALLAIALFFCMCAWFWGQCIMVPLKKDMKNLQITVISALVNIVLNFLLIPIWKENAAALTTILAEGLAFLGCRYFGKKYVTIKGIGAIVVKVFAGCIAIVFICLLMRIFLRDLLLYTFLAVFVSFVGYCIVEVLLRNEVIVNILRNVLHRILAKQGRNNTL